MLSLDCTQVFHANWNATEDILINQGGTSSSKTYSLIQLLCLKAITEPGVVITVTGESIPNLKKGAYRDTENIFSRNTELNQFVKFWNRSERIIYFKNGSLIEFISNLDAQSAKNGKRNYLFVNEAQGIEWLIFFELAVRTIKSPQGYGGKIYIDYNPTAPFWSHDNLIGTTPETNELSATVRLIISDHRHNNFLTPDEHRKIEGIKDKELWRVYARGLTGNLRGLIYPNWRMIPDADFPNDARFWGGLDFGYTNDPTAGVKIAKVGESIYLHEICYTPGIPARDLKQLFKSQGFKDDTPIYCEHDPDIITQMRRLQMLALPAQKGQGSIRAGIFKMYDYQVYYTASSKNIEEERKRYMWIIDPDTGKPTNEPEDKWNHLMDAIRYGVYTHFYKG
jgi:phage terminase large subunit